MNFNASLTLSSNIRTIASERLLRNISLKKMQYDLLELFMDRTSSDSTINFGDKDSIMQVLRYSHCKSLNDIKTIKFHNSCIQEHYVFNEDRQIWIDGGINPIEDDLFIPRDDA